VPDNFAADLRRLVAAEEGREIRELLVRVESFLVAIMEPSPCPSLCFFMQPWQYPRLE